MVDIVGVMDGHSKIQIAHRPPWTGDVAVYTRLSPRIGDRYAQIVVLCLTYLDDNNEDFGSGVESDVFIAGNQWWWRCTGDKCAVNAS